MKTGKWGHQCAIQVKELLLNIAYMRPYQKKRLIINLRRKENFAFLRGDKKHHDIARTDPERNPEDFKI